MATQKIAPRLSKFATDLTKTKPSPLWLPHTYRSMATVVPPVTQDSTSAKGPTAMVFMNMGGPSTTEEVGSFLNRLFVRSLTFSRSSKEDVH